MNVVGSNYVKLEANAVMPMNEGGSSKGGYYEGNVNILWVSPGGITGEKWYIDNPNSPFYEKNVEEIESHAISKGNLDEYFKNWGLKENIDRNSFIKYIVSDNCWEFL